MRQVLEVLRHFAARLDASPPERDLDQEPSTDWLLLFALTLDERRIVEARERRLPH